MIDIKDIVDRVRNELDEFTLGNEWIGSDSDFNDTSSSEFSTEDLADRSLGVARSIAVRVHSSHVRELIATINPTRNAELSPVTGGNYYPWFRMLLTRVRFLYTGKDNSGSAVGDDASYDAIRQTFSAYMSASSRAPSPARPVFVYNDHEFLMKVGASDGTWEDEGSSVSGGIVLDGTVNNRRGSARADVIKVPMIAGTNANYNGISLASGMSTVDWQNLALTELTIPMDAKFTRPIVNGVLASCFMTKRDAPNSNMYFETMIKELVPFLRQQFVSSQVPVISNL